MRSHEDFIPELDFVMELDGEVMGSIMYTKASLTDEDGVKKEILTFGPVCILSKYQRRGYGKMLIEHSFQTALKLGYDAVVIFGSPANYVGCGFKSCRKFHVSVEGGLYPAAMMVRELIPGAWERKTGRIVTALSWASARRKPERMTIRLRRRSVNISPVRRNFIL